MRQPQQNQKETRSVRIRSPGLTLPGLAVAGRGSGAGPSGAAYLLQQFLDPLTRLQA